MRDSRPDLAREIPLTAAGLDSAQEALEGALAAAGVGAAVRYGVRLVLEELAANLMMHGRFAGPAPPARIGLRIGAEAVILELDDAAEPFDPRATPDPSGPPDLAGEALGGLGLPLVRKMADILDYRRLPDGWNRTVLRLPLGPREPG